MFFSFHEFGNDKLVWHSPGLASKMLPTGGQGLQAWCTTEAFPAGGRFRPGHSVPPGNHPSVGRGGWDAACHQTASHGWWGWSAMEDRWLLDAGVGDAMGMFCSLLAGG